METGFNMITNFFASPNSQQAENTAVTVTVADLLDLVSGGKASQAHLKTESMKVQHGFKHKKMLRDEQRKEQEEQQKAQQGDPHKVYVGGSIPPTATTI